MDDKTYNQFNEQGQPIGVHRSWYNDMTMRSEIHYNDKGQLDGESRKWAWNGQLVERLNYKEGHLDGHQQTWYDHGDVRVDAYFKDGVANGPYTEYDKRYRDYRNASHVECNYENGQLHGEFRKYGSDGFIQEKKQYIHDVLNGPCVFYGRNQSGFPYKLAECSYRNDQLDGRYKFYYKDGKIESLDNYYYGKLERESKTFYDNGVVQESCTFKDGKREGVFESRHYNGQLEERGIFKDDKEIGKWQNWNADGVLEKERNYKDGELNGPCKEYNTDGTLFRETYFKDGLMVDPTAQADEAQVNKLASELFDKAMDSEQENHHDRGLRL